MECRKPSCDNEVDMTGFIIADGYCEPCREEVWALMRGDMEGSVMKMRMNGVMKKTAKTIIKYFFRYRNQAIKEGGQDSVGDYLFIDDEDNCSVFVMASFKTRKKLIMWLEQCPEKDFNVCEVCGLIYKKRGTHNGIDCPQCTSAKTSQRFYDYQQMEEEYKAFRLEVQETKAQWSDYFLKQITNKNT